MLYFGEHLLCSSSFYYIIFNTVTCNDNVTGVDLESYVENCNSYAYHLTSVLSACNVFHLNIVRKKNNRTKFNFWQGFGNIYINDCVHGTPSNCCNWSRKEHYLELLKRWTKNFDFFWKWKEIFRCLCLWWTHLCENGTWHRTYFKYIAKIY